MFIESVEGYFDKHAAQELALLDYEFCGQALAGRESVLVTRYRRWRKFARRYWMWRVHNIQWKTASESGAGYFIKARKDA